MSITQILSLMQARWRLIAGFCLAFAAVALLVSLVLPKKYSATSAVLVDTRAGDAMGNIDRSQITNQTIMATQLDLLQSERVSRRVVTQLKLDQDPELRREWEEKTQGKGDAVSNVALLLQKRLDMKPSRDSNVISITYTDSDAARAAKVADAFANAYIAISLDIKVEPARQYAAWFQERTQTLRTDLESAQAKLTAYQRKNNLVSAPQGQVDIENSKLAQLTTQLLEIEAARGESRSRRIQADSDGSPDVTVNPAVSTLRSEVAKARATLQELNTRLGDKHPMVESARSQLAAAQRQLDAEVRTVSKAVTGADSVNSRREGELRAALDEQRRRVLALSQSNDEVVVMQRDVENAQKALDAAAARKVTTSLESQLQQTNVYFLTPAMEPVLPSNPKILLNVAAAGLLGLMLGGALVLWREHRRPILRSPSELSLLGLPTLAVIDRVPVSSQRRLLGLLGPATRNPESEIANRGWSSQWT